MSLASEVIARRMHLPRAQTRAVFCERDLRVLAKWRRLVGAHPAADPAGLIEALGRASAGRVVILRLEHDKPWRGAVRAFAADLLVDDASAP